MRRKVYPFSIEFNFCAWFFSSTRLQDEFCEDVLLTNEQNCRNGRFGNIYAFTGPLEEPGLIDQVANFTKGQL